ncbi:MAG TPA: hypothetical protein VGN09_04935 [Vicinamibacteria bacterium]|jgi:hypothetical protein
MSAALFALGVWVSMRLLAALYRLIDLWYTIGTRWPGVAARIALWALVTTAIALGLAGPRRTAFLAGLIGFLAIYPCFYVMRNVAIRKPSG